MVITLLLSDDDGAKLRRLAEELAKIEPERGPASVEAAAYASLQMGLNEGIRLLNKMAVLDQVLDALNEGGHAD